MNNCETWHPSNLIRAIILNLIYMIVVLLLFEQFATYDDYSMAVQYAGGIGDQYAQGQTFINPLYGNMIFALNKLFPMLPWFNIMLFLFQFIGLTLMTEYILDRQFGTIGLLISNLILLFFSYEAYAGLSFTKAAGIIATCGIFFLLFDESHRWQKIIALILVCIAVLLRNLMVIMSCGIATIFVLYIYLRAILKKTAKKEKFVTNIIIIASCIIICLGLRNESIWFDKETYTNLQKQIEENNVRSRFQDYPVPAYSEQKNSYDNVGISENDIYLFRQWNYDRNKLTNKIYNVIGGKETDSFLKKVFSTDNIYKFFKSYPKTFLSQDVFFCLLLVIMILFATIKNEKMKPFLIRAMFVMILNLGIMYYFFIGGRYNQHRVDVAVELSCILGIIELCEQSGLETKPVKQQLRRYYILGILFLLVVPYTVHDEYWRTVISDDLRKQVELYDDRVADDKEHFYLLGYTRQERDIFKMYSLWNVTRNKYLNRCINTSMIANFHDDDYIAEYNIDDLYLEAIDSDVIRFSISDNNPDILHWEEYFKERAGKEVEMNLIKHCYGKLIYIVCTKDSIHEDILYKAQKQPDDSNVIHVNAEIDLNAMSINGNAFFEGSDAFEQETYLIIQDKETKKRKEYILTQEIDDSKKYDGKFSKINTSIQLPESFSENDTIWLIIREGERYAIEAISVRK